jgi:transcriptional regulator with XRE-family HTH domain
MNNLKLIRISLGETQELTAERIGVTARGYRGIENGESKPSYRNAKALEKHFKKTIDYLLEQNDDGRPFEA